MRFDEKRKMEAESRLLHLLKLMRPISARTVINSPAPDCGAVKAMLDGETFYFAACTDDTNRFAFKMNAVAARAMAVSILSQANVLFPEDVVHEQKRPPQEEIN